MSRDDMLKTKEFEFVYKCRYCGAVYNSGTTRINKLTAIRVLLDLTTNGDTDKIDGAIFNLDIHTCSTRTLGISDLVGVQEKREIKNERPV